MEKIILFAILLITLKAVPQEQPLLFKNDTTNVFLLHRYLDDTSVKFNMTVDYSDDNCKVSVVKSSGSDSIEILKVDSVLLTPKLYSFLKGESLELELVTMQFGNLLFIEKHTFYDLTNDGNIIFEYSNKNLFFPDLADDNDLLKVENKMKFKDLNGDGKFDIKLKTIRAYKKERNCSCDSRERFEITKKAILL
jgi:hypothetical protein